MDSYSLLYFFLAMSVFLIPAAAIMLFRKPEPEAPKAEIPAHRSAIFERIK